MLQSLTIDELISELQRIKRSRGLKGDELVVSCANYGDRNNTLQVVPFEVVETCPIDSTCYSESGYRVLEGDPEDTPELQTVVCLNFPY